GRIGDTMVLVTANAAKDVREGIDFFPLTVDIEERMYAAGKIPGSFFRREGRPSDTAILTARLIDRPLRPSFADGYRNETQVVVTVLGADQENPHDVLAINAASAALMFSGIPFEGTIRAAAGTRQPLAFVPQVDYHPDVAERVAQVGTDRVERVTTITAKAEREAAIEEATEAVVAEVAGEFEGREKEVRAAVRSLIKKL